jgi:hypothetical protein
VLSGLELCLQRSTGASGISGECSLDNLDEVTSAISKVSTSIDAELAQSRGLFPALSVVLSDKADLPTRPVRFQTSTLVLSGMTIGLLAAIMVLVIIFQNRQKTFHE